MKLFTVPKTAGLPHPFHRRSCAVNDAAFLANLEEGGGGKGNGFLWRPCMYLARGYCKNGSSCKFLPPMTRRPLMSGLRAADLTRMKMKAFQQQRLAAMASGGHNLFAYNKCMDENIRGDLCSAASSSA